MTIFPYKINSFPSNIAYPVEDILASNDNKIKMYLVNASQGPGLLNARVMTEYMIKPSVSRYKLDDLPKGTLININHHSNDFINIIPNITQHLQKQ